MPGPGLHGCVSLQELRKGNTPRGCISAQDFPVPVVLDTQGDGSHRRPLENAVEPGFQPVVMVIQ